MRLAVALLAFCTLLPAGELVGKRAPGFSLPDSSARFHDPADYRGKVLLVEFMQSVCPHCARFSQILEQAKAKYGDKLVILSIANPPSDQKTVAKYIADNKVTAPVLFDCGQAAYSYIRPKSANIAVPHVFLIDRSGIIRADFGYGAQNKAIFEGNGIYAEIDKLMGGK